MFLPSTASTVLGHHEHTSAADNNCQGEGDRSVIGNHTEQSVIRDTNVFMRQRDIRVKTENISRRPVTPAHPALYKLFSLLLVLLSAQHRRVSTVIESVDSLGLGLSGGEHRRREDLLHYWWQSVGIKTEKRSTRRHLFHHSVHTHHTQINSQRQPESLQTQSTHSHCSRLYCQRYFSALVAKQLTVFFTNLKQRNKTDSYFYFLLFYMGFAWNKCDWLINTMLSFMHNI